MIITRQMITLRVRFSVLALVATCQLFEAMMQFFEELSAIFASTTSAPKPTRAQTATWCAFILGALLLSLSGYGLFQLGAHGDDATYVALTQGLLHPDKFALMNAAGQPTNADFPLGYPLLLAPLALVFQNNFDALKALSLLATLLNATLLFWGWRFFSQHKSYWWANGGVALYLFSPLTIGHTRMVMSEPVFTTFVLIALFLAEEAAAKRAARGWTLAMSVTLLLAVLIRTVGLVLVFSIFANLLRVRGMKFWKDLALIIVGISVVLGILLAITPLRLDHVLPARYLRYLGSYRSNTSGTAISPVVDPRIYGIQAYLFQEHVESDIPQLVFPLLGGGKQQAFAERLGLPWLLTAIGLVTTGLMVLGYYRWFAQEGLSVVRLFTLVYLATLFIWVWEGPRLLYPIQPPLQLALLLGIEGVLLWAGSIVSRMIAPTRFKAVIFAAVFLLLFGGSIYKSLRIDDSRLHTGDLQARSSWLQANTSASDIVMSEDPTADFLYSGRKMVPYPNASASADQFEYYLRNNNIRYILVAPEIKWQPKYIPEYSQATTRILPLLKSLILANRLSVVYSSESELIQVLNIRPD